MEDNSLCEKIIKSLDNLISTDNSLLEFCVIPSVENNTNKSPIQYENHCIGLESWCKKHILQYTHRELLRLRKKLKYNALTEDQKNHINNLLNASLLLHPGVVTFWNMKRELFLHNILDFQKELLISKLILSEHSKSSETFAYRRWIIQNIFSNQCDIIQILVNVIDNEFAICNMTAEKCSNNYHAWSHRIWCLKYLEKIPSISNFTDIHFLNELEYSNKFIKHHISEYSGFHYRQVLLHICYNHEGDFKLIIYLDYLIKFVKKELTTPSDIIQYLLGEFVKNISSDKLNRFVNALSIVVFDFYMLLDLGLHFSSHETIWLYRRFLVNFLFKIVNDLYGLTFRPSISISSDFKLDKEYSSSFSDQMTNKSQQTNKFFNSNLYKIILNNELKVIKDGLSSNNTLEKKFAKRYEKWWKCLNM